MGAGRGSVRGTGRRAGGDALFTVYNDMEFTRLLKAAGVHLGQEDEPVPKAREILGPDAVVGRSATVGAPGSAAVRAVLDAEDPEAARQLRSLLSPSR